MATATLPFNFTDAIIQAMFGNGHNSGNGHTSTLRHPTNNDINLDLFVDGLHDKLARIFSLINRINRHGGGGPLTVEEDDLFTLLSKVQPPGVNNETIMQHFKKYVTTVSVIPLFKNINQDELRVKDIFKFFFLICISSLFDPADTSGENFIKQLRIKTNNPTITLPFEATANHGIFDILSQHTYSMCGDKLLYAYICRLTGMLAAQQAQASAYDWSAGGDGNPPRNVTERHLLIINFAWQCTLAYIQSISRDVARFPNQTAGHNQNFPIEAEINIALGVLSQIEFVGFILQTPTQAVQDNINDYRHYTYANATFVFRNEQPPQTAAPFAVSQGIAAECINELHEDVAALPREGAPHRYKVQCKAKLQGYIDTYSVVGQGGRGLTAYEKSIIYVLLKFAGDTSHIVNYMLFKNAIDGIGLHLLPNTNPPQPLPVLPVVGQLKTTIFCCERALIARCIQENHSFYCRDVKILSQEVPLALGDCYYFNVNPMEEYSMKSSLLESFRASAGELQGDIDTAIGILNTFIGPPGGPQGPPPNATEEERIEQLITFINFYKAYKKFVLFIESSKGKYDEFIRDVFPSHFQNRTARSSRAGKILNMLTPLTLLHGNIKNKKNFELISLIYSAYYGPLVSILSQLEKNHITTDIGTMGMGLGSDILETLQTVQGNFTTKINIAGLRRRPNEEITEEDIRGMLNPENNLNDAKTVESLLNIIKSQRYIDDNLQQTIDRIGAEDAADAGHPPLSGGATGANPLRLVQTTLDNINNYTGIIYNDSYPEEFIRNARNQPPYQPGGTYYYSKENLSRFILEKIEFHNEEIIDKLSRKGIWREPNSKRRRTVKGSNNDNGGGVHFTTNHNFLPVPYSPVGVSGISEINRNVENNTRYEEFIITKNYDYTLLIEYFASMVEYEVTQNILDEALQHAPQEVHAGLTQILVRYGENAQAVAQDNIAFINNNLPVNEQVNAQYLNALLNWGIQCNGVIDQELEPLQVNVTIQVAWAGGKNIRSVSKMYRKNNKKVKKTRKIKKNNYKKSKTSKKMTKTSVQNKKSIKNKDIKSKGIKNMKNTKNKKINKSKTKKDKKN